MSDGPDDGSDRKDPDEPGRDRLEGAQPAGQNPMEDLFGALFGALGGPGGQLPALPEGLANLPGMPSDPRALQQMLAQVQQLMSGTGGDGPVNWDLARQVARQVVAAAGDPSVPEPEQRQVAEALRTADLWLDRACELPAATARSDAWSRAEWVEQTFPTWQLVVEPVAARVGAAMTDAMSSQAPAELSGMLAGAVPMIRKMAAGLFGAQVGQAIGALAGEVVGGGDVGLPLLPAGRTALVPANVQAFGQGLGLPLDEVRLYLALREAAHARLVAGVPWLRSHLMAAVEDYARGITIDTERIEAAVREIDPTDPQSMQDALSSGLFEPQHTPAQRAALERLETALALVEGWVDEVVDAAARTGLPHADALRETVRRRRAAGGPAEHTFAALVGLELRPRRLREAAAVWAALGRARGTAGRDELWSHPDLVPDAASFSDPESFAAPPTEGGPEDELDAALERLLDDGGSADGGGSTDDDSGDGGDSPDRGDSPDGGAGGPQPAQP